MGEKTGESREMENLQALLRRRLQEGWSFEKIEPMSTKEIMAKFNRLGIPLTEENYRRAAQGHDSAERLSDEWLRQYPFHPESGYDDDFVWMAAIVLWKRLVPDRVSFEQIDERMQDGYDLLEEQRITEACDAWWQVWQWLADKVTPERNTIDALDEAFVGTQLVSNWCQDFEMELGNAGLDDPRYFRLRIRYVQEFLGLFADVGALMRGNFLRAEAESYWRLGDRETAEVRLEALIQENPAWPWGYIDWADLYWLYDDSPKDYARGEQILRRALARRDLEDREDVQDRLQSLRAERARARKADARRTKRKRPPKRRKRRKDASSPRPPPAGPTLVTPEGDPLVFARARYTLTAPPGDRRAGMDEIAQILSQAADFGEGTEVDLDPGEGLQFPWYETEPGAKPPPDPMDRRVLAMVTLTTDELEVETMSRQRMARCRRRLEDLLGARIHLAEATAKSAAQVLAEPPPEDAPEPVTLPPEAIAELEERMLRQWLDESIPALEGMTPREAARTPEGREMLEDLLAYIERRYPRERRAPGTMSPDYRKARKMLGLE